MTSGAVGQLSRLLALIPWLLARPGVGLDETATEFGVTPEQLRKDLDLAFMCGLPGHLPDDLIDVSIEGNEIVVTNADTIARPLRLGSDEAVALMVGLQTLTELPGVHDRELLDRVSMKLQRAAGDAAEASARIQVRVEVDAEVLAELRPAIDSGRRVRLRYYVPSRDEITEREVDPIRLAVVDGRTYLEAFCYTAEAVRHFRLDRIDPDSIAVLDTPIRALTPSDQPDLSEGIFRPDPHHQLATLAVSPEGRWIAEAFPVDDVTTAPDGSAVITLRVADPAWLVRLVLRLGGSARVVDPPEWAELVTKAAREALAAY